MRKRKNLLDIFVWQRTYKALDRAVGKDKRYLNASKQQDKVFAALDKLGLDKEQRTMVDKAITVTNECGTAYGVVAYKLGLHDGIKLTAEIREII